MPDYSYKSSGTNSQGNHYCSRDYGSGASNSNSYHYSNSQVPLSHSTPLPVPHIPRPFRPSRAPRAIQLILRSDGSYYYSNSDGSKYYNNGAGGSTYTPPSGSSSSSSSGGKK